MSGTLMTAGSTPIRRAASGSDAPRKDAMVHAIEAYTSALKKNPLSDLLVA